MKAIITVGISASGKSTWTKDFIRQRNLGGESWIEINRDSIRASIVAEKRGIPLEEAEENLWSYWSFTKKAEEEVTETQNNSIKVARDVMLNVIISDTNLDSGQRMNLQTMLEDLGYEVELKKFDITLEEAWKRDARRKNGVGHLIIYRQWRKLHPALVPENRVLPKAVIFDVDGTLACMTGRTAYEWDKVGQDTVDPIVKSLCNTLYDEGYVVIIMSGRDSVCRKHTEDWLKTHGINYSVLYMRAQDDMRKDTIVKEELYMSYVYGKYNVVRVVDDRPSVCRKWRDLGLNVIQVADPLIEF